MKKSKGQVSGDDWKNVKGPFLKLKKSGKKESDSWSVNRCGDSWEIKKDTSKTQKE